MKRFALLVGIAVASLSLGACSTTQLEKLNTASANFQAAVATINADIAAVAPLVAKSCGDLQTAAMLLKPLVPTKAKAPQYFAAANAALTAYCQVVPTDINSTAKAVAAAVVAANAGYKAAVGQ